MWSRLNARIAQLAETHLPAGAHVLVIGPKSGSSLITILEQRGLIATGMADIPNRHTDTSQLCGASADMLVLVMSLSTRSRAERYAVAEAAQKLAPLTLLVDWQRAERNLEVPADIARRLFFRLTRPRSWRRSMADYDSAGGLNAVLYAWRRQGRVAARQSCQGGCVGLALLAWDQAAEPLPYRK